MATTTTAPATAPAAATETAPAPPKPLLDIVTPTPPDIVIAQSVKPRHISQIAEGKLGLAPDEYEMHGPAKAKVRLSVLDRLKDAPAGKYGERAMGEWGEAVWRRRRLWRWWCVWRGTRGGEGVSL